MSALRILILTSVALGALGVFCAQPSCHTNPATEFSIDSSRLETHVKKLSIDFRPRDYRSTENLDEVAAYIKGHFERAGADTDYQTFKASGGNTYRNVLGRFGTGDRRRLIVGAHYDAYGDLPGADDNASGVAGLIELAYLMGSVADSLAVDIELVAYTLEEPPFFETDKMGSAVHARSIQGEKDKIIGVLVFEMIGYFSDEPDSQSLPSPLMRLVYPGRGSFIAVISNMPNRGFTAKTRNLMQGRTPLRVHCFNAPAEYPGIGFSDHASYWPYDIPAIMITDTAFYRNKAYHTANDTYDRLDYERMGQVVLATFEAIREWHKTEAE